MATRRIIREFAWVDPAAAFAGLAERPWSRLLHSPDGAAGARWSVVVCEPARRLEADAAGAFLDGARDPRNPFDIWRAEAAARACEPADGEPPFGTGAVGLVGYEAAPFADPAAPAAGGGRRALEVGFYDAALVFDGAKRRVRLVARGAARGADVLERAMSEAAPAAAEPLAAETAPPDVSEAGYMERVSECAARIRRGDFFQANLSRMLRGRLLGRSTPYEAYRRMIAVDPAPMAAFLVGEGGATASISPERFLRVARGPGGALLAAAEPIKGTAARGLTPADDAAARAALLGSAKDRAENVMIVDLLRNDLAKVCRDGTMAVPVLCEARAFAGVHHLVSRIEAEIRPRLGAVDVLQAAFPCGSITGAPKIEAMRFILEAEGRPRAAYTGAVGYVDDAGEADFSVAIRTAAFEGSRFSYGIGGGVTALSDPQAEYQETEAKAATFLRAIGAISGARAA